MQVRFGSITFVSGDAEKVRERLAELKTRKGIALTSQYGEQGVCVDGRDAQNFLEDRLDLSLPTKPFLLSKEKFDADPAHRQQVDPAIEEGLQANGYNSLEDVCERFLYDRMLIKLEDGIDADQKPVKEETV